MSLEALLEYQIDEGESLEDSPEEETRSHKENKTYFDILHKYRNNEIRLSKDQMKLYRKIMKNRLEVNDQCIVEALFEVLHRSDFEAELEWW